MTPEVPPEVYPEVGGFPPEVPGEIPPEASRAHVGQSPNPNFGVRGGRTPEATPEDAGSASLPPHFGGGAEVRMFAGQRYVAAGEVEHTTMAGEVVRLRLWDTHCAACGSPLRIKQMERAGKWSPSRRCAECKAPGSPVAAKRTGADGKSRHKAQRAAAAAKAKAAIRPGMTRAERSAINKAAWASRAGAP